jgi:hypothetical protein
MTRARVPEMKRRGERKMVAGEASKGGAYADSS